MPWRGAARLFPGGQPGRPVSADRLGERLRQLGLRPGQGPLDGVVPSSPPNSPRPVLACLRGIRIKVAAVAWQHVSAGGWTSYAADVSRRRNITSLGIPGKIPDGVTA